jgi:hypothetical protein
MRRISWTGWALASATATCTSCPCSTRPDAVSTVSARSLWRPDPVPALFDAGLVAKVIERERPTFLLGVPTMIVGLLAEAGKGRDLTSIERFLSGGSTGFHRT